jgi:hypothetical protein
VPDFEIHHMTLLHRCDDDKEFCSYNSDTYDCHMFNAAPAAERLRPLTPNVDMGLPVGAATRRFLSAFLLLLALDRVAAAQAPTQHLALVFPPESTLQPTVIRAAAAEAADIWAPNGVAVDLAAPWGSAPDDSETLTVAIARSLSTDPEPWHGTLGVIIFDASGAPRPRMTVYFDRLMELISGAPIWIANEQHWPRALRDKVIGRALGRVIAHEIGHFVLRSRDHASNGLMRRVQGSDELIAPDRSRFALWRPATRTVTR